MGNYCQDKFKDNNNKSVRKYSRSHNMVISGSLCWIGIFDPFIYPYLNL